VEIRAVKPGDDRFRIPERQLAADVAADLGRGGGGQRDRSRRAKLFADLLDAEIARSEIVTPLADAMRFVDGEERYSRLAKPLGRLPVVETLGRYVEELDLAALSSCESILNLTRGLGAVDERRWKSPRGKRVDLILHQGNERRHHDGESGHQQSRHLEAERLPATGREHDNSVPSRQYR
jgi:hypothetical protein